MTCACGETFITGSVRKELRVDICSKCHPFFTGKQKLVDTGAAWIVSISDTALNSRFGLSQTDRFGLFYFMEGSFG